MNIFLFCTTVYLLCVCVFWIEQEYILLLEEDLLLTEAGTQLPLLLKYVLISSSSALLCICLFVCVFVCLCTCLFVCWLACLLVCLFVCMFVCLLVCLLVTVLCACLFVCLFVWLFVCVFGLVWFVCVCSSILLLPSFCLSVLPSFLCLFVCLFTCFLVCLNISDQPDQASLIRPCSSTAWSTLCPEAFLLATRGGLSLPHLTVQQGIYIYIYSSTDYASLLSVKTLLHTFQIFLNMLSALHITNCFWHKCGLYSITVICSWSGIFIA